jgi:hypothetical protein
MSCPFCACGSVHTAPCRPPIEVARAGRRGREPASFEPWQMSAQGESAGVGFAQPARHRLPSGPSHGLVRTAPRAPPLPLGVVVHHSRMGGSVLIPDFVLQAAQMSANAFFGTGSDALEPRVTVFGSLAVPLPPQTLSGRTPAVGAGRGRTGGGKLHDDSWVQSSGPLGCSPRGHKFTQKQTRPNGAPMRSFGLPNAKSRAPLFPTLTKTSDLAKSLTPGRSLMDFRRLGVMGALPCAECAC